MLINLNLNLRTEEVPMERTDVAMSAIAYITGLHAKLVAEALKGDSEMAGVNSLRFLLGSAMLQCQ